MSFTKVAIWIVDIPANLNVGMIVVIVVVIVVVVIALIGWDAGWWCILY